MAISVHINWCIWLNFVSHKIPAHLDTFDADPGVKGLSLLELVACADLGSDRILRLQRFARKSDTDSYSHSCLQSFPLALSCELVFKN